MADDIQPDETGKPKDLTRDQVQKISRELDPVIQIDENRLRSKCQCGSEAFIVVLTKNQTLSMGAKIVSLVCCICRRVHTVSDRGNMGEKQTHQDADGRNHHVIKCETGYLNGKGGSNG